MSQDNLSNCVYALPVNRKNLSIEKKKKIHLVPRKEDNVQMVFNLIAKYLVSCYDVWDTV